MRVQVLQRISFVIFISALLAASCAAQVQPGEGSSSSRDAERHQASEQSLAPLPVFEFHSGFWINLHHFLYQQARLRNSSAPAGTGADPTGQSESSARAAAAAQVLTSALTGDEQRAWTAALDYYAEDLAARDLLVNGDMVNIKNRLAEMETCADLSGRSAGVCASGLRRELIAALERAAPVYRARWWDEHDRTNRSWIAGVAPLVRQMGGGLAQRLSAVYQADWPTGRLRVDVVFYGGPFGAYTTLDPVHLTISSSDPRNQGVAALEVLFHEASHALARAVRDAIVRECRQRGKPIPRDLWHALLFYTTGEIVKRALQNEKAVSQPAGTRPDTYTPYAYRYGLYARGWSNYQRLLERHWQPYLDGKVEFETALARLVSAL
ncbi:MAG: hypothetical protein HY237_12725 [Acidobacteria bacterium]|nr:hypothetical protein [Acidobacteriota bacterium]